MKESRYIEIERQHKGAPTYTTTTTGMRYKEEEHPRKQAQAQPPPEDWEDISVSRTSHNIGIQLKRNFMKDR
jgi:hypothetical protein